MTKERTAYNLLFVRPTVPALTQTRLCRGRLDDWQKIVDCTRRYVKASGCGPGSPDPLKKSLATWPILQESVIQQNAFYRALIQSFASIHPACALDSVVYQLLVEDRRSICLMSVEPSHHVLKTGRYWALPPLPKLPKASTNGPLACRNEPQSLELQLRGYGNASPRTSHSSSLLFSFDMQQELPELFHVAQYKSFPGCYAYLGCIQGFPGSRSRSFTTSGSLPSKRLRECADITTAR